MYKNRNNIKPYTGSEGCTESSSHPGQANDSDWSSARIGQNTIIFSLDWTLKKQQKNHRNRTEICKS